VELQRLARAAPAVPTGFISITRTKSTAFIAALPAMATAAFKRPPENTATATAD